MCGVGDSSVVFITGPNGFGWHWPKVVIPKIILFYL